MPRSKRIATDSTERSLHLATAYGNALNDNRSGRIAQEKGGAIAAVLNAYPEVAQDRTFVLELAYDEYRQRCQAGESPDMREFARQFPAYETSLYLYLGVQELIGEELASENTAWPQPGDSFLGFSIIEELGRGAFARVFLASEDALGDRLVALKVALHGGEEATILGRLEHPNVVPIHSVQHDSNTGLTAVCMPFLGRATLIDVLDRSISVGAPYDDAVVRLTLQLAEALGHGHQRGICHRDMKPSNVLLTFDDRALLLDFNLSVDDRSWLERIGGTLPYMAPEGLAAIDDAGAPGPLLADPRSDLFSLGVILYQLLCGELPFEPDRWDTPLTEVAEDMLGCQRIGPDASRLRRKGVSKQLEEIVLRCLAFEPDERFQTAAELAGQLRRYFRSTQRIKRSVRRHPWRVSAIASFAAVVLAISGTYLAMRPPYSVRQLNRGLAYYEQADYQQALDCLNESIRYDRASVDALFARGRTYMQLEKYELAFESFNTAHRLSGEPLLWAASGYCAAKFGSPQLALRCCTDAFDAGDRSASLLNNIGYLHMRQARLEEGERYLLMALDADPNLAAAHHNLLVVHYNRFCNGEPVPAATLEVAARAVAVVPPSADVYRHVATLCCLAAQDDPILADDGLLWLERAMECGLDREEVAESPMFSILHGTPEFERLLAMPASTTQPSPPQRLVPPL